MNYKNYKNLNPNLSNQGLLKEVGVSYIGGVATSTKLNLSFKNGTATYGIYLAPWSMAKDRSGFADIPNVCGGGQYCHESCLNESGHGKINALKSGSELSVVNIARIKKTLLFYQNNPIFMRLVSRELENAKKKAEKDNFEFSVRLNCTSDISPEKFILDNGKNILQAYPEVQFYDYTKIASRMALMNDYPNYWLTFSYDGHNWDKAEELLNKGFNVAVVFYSPTNKLPKTFGGFEVIDGNLTDIRYKDKRGVVVGLHYHPVANDYKNHTFIPPTSGFVVLEGDNRAEW